MGDMTNQGLQQGGFDLTQFYSVFFEEAGENLANMESMLLEIDVDNATDEELNGIFRVAHSIKGGAATFGFSDVTVLTHELETLLDRLRRHELPLKRGMVDVLLEAGDVLKAQLARYQGATDQSPDTTDLVGRVKRLAAGEVIDKIDDGQRRLVVRVGPLKDGSVAENLAELFRDIPSLGTLEAIDGGNLSAEGMRTFKVTTASPDSELVELFSFHVDKDHVRIEPWASAPASAATPGPAAPAAPAAPLADGKAGEPIVAVEGEGYGFFVDPNHLVGRKEPAPSDAGAAPDDAAPRADGKAKAKADKAANLESTSLRVSVEKVDQLINLIGELVITQAMLTQQSKNLDPVQFQGLLAGVSDLERNTRHLQESVMSIRMIPMSFVFNRFPRMIRDLTAKLGKEIELKMIGEATELDKGLIEKIIDPLTHLVRNSADHGIETPARRLAAGKSATGTITLSASHQGGSILIEVRDDGQGLRRDKILAKARERGLPTRDDMSDAEVWALIWEPGFSTADQVSDVSGRGVGMDVVKRNIAALGGSVELDSAEGYGMRVSVRLPLTLAIMDGMSIGVGEEIYILPLSSVVESFQVEKDSIQTIGSTGRVVKVREEFMPVVALDEMFAVPRFDYERVSEIMVIVEADGRRVAVLVDELLGQHQVVVKNLEANYRRVQGVSGATILGDGRVALIIDVAGFVKRTRH
ncbi:MAG TPA: chemotaxis protein CheW [Burkholderiaceae bacterium]|nr:chemotaxis protein CheW [Burkholderiaceae bacterium]